MARSDKARARAAATRKFSLLVYAGTSKQKGGPERGGVIAKDPKSVPSQLVQQRASAGGRLFSLLTMEWLHTSPPQFPSPPAC